MEDCNLNLDGSSYMALWAAWKCPSNVPVVLAKGRSRVRPFASAAAPKTFLLCINDPTQAGEIFSSAIRFLKAGDFVVLVAVVETRDAKGDNRDFSRFDMGKRSGWVVPPAPGSQVAAKASISLGWNDAQVEALTAQMEGLLASSLLKGKVRVETTSQTLSVAQTLSNVAKEEGVDIMVLVNRDRFREIVVDCAKESPCSVILIK